MQQKIDTDVAEILNEVLRAEYVIRIGLAEMRVCPYCDQFAVGHAVLWHRPDCLLKKVMNLLGSD